MSRRLHRDARAVSPVVGIALLVGLTALLAAGVGATAFGFASEMPDAPSSAMFSLSVTDDRVMLRHERGDVVDVRELAVVVAVDGDPIRIQPPVPFFAAAGFHAGPTGPFNVASDPNWSVGERASFRLAGTNTEIPTGARVTVTLARDDRLLARVSTVAQSADSGTTARVVIARGAPG